MKTITKDDFRFNEKIEADSIAKLREIYNGNIPPHFGSYSGFLERKHPEEYAAIVVTYKT